MELRRRSFLVASTGAAATACQATTGAGRVAHPTTVGNPAGVHWTVASDGTFSLVAGRIQLRDAIPGLDGAPFVPTEIVVDHTGDGGRIVYRTTRGEIELQLGVAGEVATLRARLHTTESAVWFYPLARVRVEGADRLLKQGMGFGGPSAVFEIPSASKRREAAQLTEAAWTHDSYLVSGAMAADGSALAIGAYRHRDYLQRTSFYNVQRRYGLVDRHLEKDSVHADVGFEVGGAAMPADGLVMPTLYFRAGAAPFATFRKHAEAIAADNAIVLKRKPSYHYCSWYLHEKEFSLDKLKALLDGLAAHQPRQRLDTIQIDDGYSLRGDWLIPNQLWPGGLERAFGAIADKGYTPGVWIGPFMVDERSRVFAEYPEWLFRDGNGAPIPHWNNADGKTYELDTSHPGAMDYLRGVFRTLRKWGAVFFKTDFMEWGMGHWTGGRRHTPGKTPVQNYVDVCRMIREEIGPDSYWLGCIAPFAPMLGFVDAIRVGNDVGPEWGSSTLMNMVREMHTGQFMNGVLWQNDPDVLYLRRKKTKLSDNETEALALYNGMLGGVVNTSDEFHSLDPDRLKLWHFVEPGPAHDPAVLPFWDRPGAVITAVRHLPKAGGWAVLLFNGGDQAQRAEHKLQALVAQPNLAIFRWSPGAFTAVGRAETLTAELAPRSTALFFLAEKDTPPPANLTLGGVLSAHLPA